MSLYNLNGAAFTHTSAGLDIDYSNDILAAILLGFSNGSQAARALEDGPADRISALFQRNELFELVCLILSIFDVPSTNVAQLRSTKFGLSSCLVSIWRKCKYVRSQWYRPSYALYLALSSLAPGDTAIARDVIEAFGSASYLKRYAALIHSTEDYTTAAEQALVEIEHLVNPAAGSISNKSLSSRLYELSTLALDAESLRTRTNFIPFAAMPFHQTLTRNFSPFYDHLWCVGLHRLGRLEFISAGETAVYDTATCAITSFTGPGRDVVLTLPDEVRTMLSRYESAGLLAYVFYEVLRPVAVQQSFGSKGNSNSNNNAFVVPQLAMANYELSAYLNGQDYGPQMMQALVCRFANPGSGLRQAGVTNNSYNNSVYQLNTSGRRQISLGFMCRSQKTLLRNIASYAAAAKENLTLLADEALLLEGRNPEDPTLSTMVRGASVIVNGLPIPFTRIESASFRRTNELCNDPYFTPSPADITPAIRHRIAQMTTKITPSSSSSLPASTKRYNNSLSSPSSTSEKDRAESGPAYETDPVVHIDLNTLPIMRHPNHYYGDPKTFLKNPSTPVSAAKLIEAMIGDSGAKTLTEPLGFMNPYLVVYLVKNKSKETYLAELLTKPRLVNGKYYTTLCKIAKRQQLLLEILYDSVASDTFDGHSTSDSECMGSVSRLQGICSSNNVGINNRTAKTNDNENDDNNDDTDNSSSSSRTQLLLKNSWYAVAAIARAFVAWKYITGPKTLPEKLKQYDELSFTLRTPDSSGEVAVGTITEEENPNKETTLEIGIVMPQDKLEGLGKIEEEEKEGEGMQRTFQFTINSETYNNRLSRLIKSDEKIVSEKGTRDFSDVEYDLWMAIFLKPKINIGDYVVVAKEVKGSGENEDAIGKADQEDQENSDDEVEIESSQISLKTAISQKRIEIPIRTYACNHFEECMDLDEYLERARRINAWNCIKCSKNAPYESLYLDGFVMFLLEHEFEAFGDSTLVNIDEKSGLPIIDMKPSVLQAQDASQHDEESSGWFDD